jgi:23S rRNA (pseudouridine1915-N3)-methyltransferase
MKVAIVAVGRMKAGPEKELAGRYLERFDKAAPSLGIEFSGVDEIAEGRATDAPSRKSDEAQRLRERVKPGSAIIVLDERGKSLSSEKFASLIAEIRDSGQRELIFAIGGPDGHDPAFAASADRQISFGTQTWPHQLVRIMLAEQLYRAATILSGHPYHRA